MVRRLAGRVAPWVVRVTLALALLGDAPQQLAFEATSAGRSSAPEAGALQAGPGGERPAPGRVTRLTTMVVTGVAWLAFVSLPYAEPFPQEEGGL